MNPVALIRIPGFPCDLRDLGACVRGFRAEAILNASGCRARFEDFAGLDGLAHIAAVRRRKRLAFGLENEFTRNLADSIKGLGPADVGVLLVESPGALKFAAKLLDHNDIRSKFAARFLWVPSALAEQIPLVHPNTHGVPLICSDDAEAASREIAGSALLNGGPDVGVSRRVPVYPLLSAAAASAPFYDLAEDPSMDSVRDIQMFIAGQRMVSHGVPHIEIASGSRSNGQRLAQALLVARAAAPYSRTADPNNLTENCARLLKLSGCAAVSLRIHTGSQYMLDRYYRRDVTVAEAERAVRACKSAAIFTVARFTYPAELDDYHTAAETLRFIVRTRPHSALIERDHTVADDRRRRNARRDLQTQIQALGVCTGITAREAALAAAAGMEGRELEFAMDLRTAIERGDVEYLRAIFEDLRERIGMSRSGFGFAASSPFFKAAVN